MLDDLLPDDFYSFPIDKLTDAAQHATKSGNFAQAAAILAKGYELGGPPDFMDQAYTYAHYLIVSRRMVRRGAKTLKSDHSQAILDNFSSLYSDDLVDRLEAYFDSELGKYRGGIREPSGALLLKAELCLANGADPREMAGKLPESESAQVHAQFLIARAYCTDGKLDKAQEVLEKILEKSPRNQDALNLLGSLSLSRGNINAAAFNFDRGLHAEFAPSPDNVIPAGEIHYRSTILNQFDVYEYSGGFAVVKKQADLIGVTILGEQILQLMDSPGYSLWLRVKFILGRFFNISQLKALLFPTASGESKNGIGRSKLIVQRIFRYCDRVLIAIDAEHTRPHFKAMGMIVYRFIRPAGVVLRPMKIVLKPPYRLLRRCGLQFSRIVYRTVLFKWIKAKEVPLVQRSKNVDDIFPIVNKLLQQDEHNVFEELLPIAADNLVTHRP